MRGGAARIRLVMVGSLERAFALSCRISRGGGPRVRRVGVRGSVARRG